MVDPTTSFIGDPQDEEHDPDFCEVPHCEDCGKHFDTQGNYCPACAPRHPPPAPLTRGFGVPSRDQPELWCTRGTCGVCDGWRAARRFAETQPINPPSADDDIPF